MRTLITSEPKYMVYCVVSCKNIPYRCEGWVENTCYYEYLPLSQILFTGMDLIVQTAPGVYRHIPKDQIASVDINHNKTKTMYSEI